LSSCVLGLCANEFTILQSAKAMSVSSTYRVEIFNQVQVAHDSNRARATEWQPYHPRVTFASLVAADAADD